jgi:Mrp family chromosome partitioning ATPase
MPHAQFVQLTGYTDTTLVGPYHDVPGPTLPAAQDRMPSPPTVPETPLARTAKPAAPVLPSHPTPLTPAAPLPTKNTPAVPPNEPARPAPETAPENLPDTLRSAAAVRLPASLELPTMFQPSASEEAEEAVPKDLTPDWEVDRFAWPSVCERLLATRSRYFQHVGRRLKAAIEDNHHVLLVTSSRRGEGRTTLALCLARCAAEAGVKVALVDADVRNPELSTRLGLETPCSWLEVLAGKAALREAAVASVEDHLTLFPLIRAEEAATAAQDGRFAAVLRQMSTHFPLLIMDSGPVTDDSLDPFRERDDCLIDTAIIVRDLRNTTEKKALATAQQLQQSGIPAVGIAENFGIEQ